MQICDYEKCTGCTACINACPASCINMKQYGDEAYPCIDEDKCIGCNKCKSVCPANSPVKLNKPIKAFACWSKLDDIHMSSTSGGMATVFGKKIISDGGVVFGAKSEFADGELKVFHTDAANYTSLLAFQGSKYVKSEIGTSFRKIKKFLKEDKKVLFCGTPCQIAGLKSYLGDVPENLILVDLICHGTPNIEYLNKHIKENIKARSNLAKIKFRKNNKCCLTILDNKDDIVLQNSLHKDNYLIGFLSALFYSEACYSCPYAQENRTSDITVGDFWGLGKNVPFEHKTDNGVSVCLINTKKGESFFKSVQDECEVYERTVEEAVLGNNQLRHPSAPRFCNRRRFLKLRAKGVGFNKAVCKSAYLAKLKYTLIDLINKW